MIILILLLLTLIGVGCYIYISKPNTRKISSKKQHKCDELFNSNNTNSYSTAGEVFKTLNEAGFDSSFLGDN